MRSVAVSVKMTQTKAVSAIESYTGPPQTHPRKIFLALCINERKSFYSDVAN